MGGGADAGDAPGCAASRTWPRTCGASGDCSGAGESRAPTTVRTLKAYAQKPVKEKRDVDHDDRVVALAGQANVARIEERGHAIGGGDIENVLNIVERAALTGLVHINEVRVKAVHERAQSEAVVEARVKVGDRNIRVRCDNLLDPAQQLLLGGDGADRMTCRVRWCRLCAH